MSENKHTYDVLIEFLSHGNSTPAFRDSMVNYAQDYINEAQNLYNSIDRTKLDFKTELRKLFCITNDSTNNISFDYETFIDAIIKDMGIETEEEQ